MLRTRTYLSSSTSVLHCVTSSCASKGPLWCPRWTFESSPNTGHHVATVRIIICSHPRPLQHTSPQSIGRDVHLAGVPQLQTRSSTLTKKPRSCAVPFVFSCQASCQASFRPLLLGLKYMCIYIYIYIHAYIHTYIITYIHTYIYLYLCRHIPVLSPCYLVLSPGHPQISSFKT